MQQLLGLTWARAEEGSNRSRVRELVALQRPDGAWAQTPHLSSDAYATGQVLYTLRDDPSWRGLTLVAAARYEYQAALAL